ncbi:hypothetical protein [Allosphingosinicella deserti]|uniref:Uncharacterized protein n=1 Tax=Allosphingosinicella deserti TaxID=2116704 RepID=A0A2P7QZ35_9SPHN|nr:hypothetical protein [Sphingomonas deserti]PSJ43231.1 hypothetical protein C7I55_02290 [Sphingomonas deserti]
MASGRGKAGRKPKAGARYKCGRLRPVREQGNDRIAALAARFQPFQGGKAGQWVRDSAIGRAWAVGLLDGHDADPSAIRDAGLGYAARYWSNYPTAAGVANYEGVDRRGRGLTGGGADPGGLAFQRLDRAIAATGRASYEAVQSLVVDTHWSPQDNPAWLDRLINARLVHAGVHADGPFPTTADFDRLKLAVEGLLATVRGERTRSTRPIARSGNLG